MGVTSDNRGQNFMVTNQARLAQAGGPSANPTSLLDKASFSVSNHSVSQLIGQAYASAPAAERSRLLEHLLKPLGILSLMAVANGIFAVMLFRSGSPISHIRLEDTQNVHIDDVIALVEHVQQVSVESVESLVQSFMNCSVLTSAAAPALLVAVLLQQTKIFGAGEVEGDDE
jgi:hypothetical protein